MKNLETKMVDIDHFELPKPKPNDSGKFHACLLTENNIEILRTHFQQSNYTFNGMNVAKTRIFSVGNILYFESNGKITFDILDSLSINGKSPMVNCYNYIFCDL